MLHTIPESPQQPARTLLEFERRCLQVGKLPNGDRLVLNPDDHFVYQIDPARQLVLSRFCSLELWHAQYAEFFALEAYHKVG